MNWPLPFNEVKIIIMDLHFDIRDLLNAYKRGLFPMAEDACAETFFFYEPENRGILPIDRFKISKSLKKEIRKKRFTITADLGFKGVIDECARSTPERPKTWINKGIRDLFIALHQAGHAHSIECRDMGGRLIGGLYGLSLGAVFFGESMFSRETNASKVALCHLMARLWKGGYTLVDTQFVNPHLLQFGALEIPQQEYMIMLGKALLSKGQFFYEGAKESLSPDVIESYFDYLDEFRQHS